MDELKRFTAAAFAFCKAYEVSRQAFYWENTGTDSRSQCLLRNSCIRKGGKRTDIRELTAAVGYGFVKKITAYTLYKSSGSSRQKIRIIWNIFGELEQDGDRQTAERQRKTERHSQEAMPFCKYYCFSL